jgi:hypothetical protein
MNKKQIVELLEEVYFEVLVEGGELPTATDEILSKFPTLRDNIIKLLTKEYGFFIDEISWVSPKPSTFKIHLKNGQFFLLKWLGKGFQAQIEGKRFFLKNINEYQAALGRLNELLKYGPAGETASGDDEFGSEEGGDDFGGEEDAGGADSGTTDAEGEDVFDTGEE